MTNEEKEDNLKKYGTIYPDGILVNADPFYLTNMKVAKGEDNEAKAIVWGMRNILFFVGLVLAISYGLFLLIS